MALLDSLLSSVKSLSSNVGASISSSPYRGSSSYPVKFTDVVSVDLATTSSWYVQLPIIGSYQCPYPWLICNTDIALDSIETKSVRRKNREIQIPESIKSSDLTIKIYETSDWDNLRYFKVWRDLVIDQNGYVGRHNDYRFNFKVVYYKRISNNPEKPPTPIYFTVKEAWPTGDVKVSFSNGSAEALSYDITFSHSGVFPTWTND